MDTMKRKTIGVIGAMEAEVSYLKEKLESPKVFPIAGMEFVLGELNGLDVVVVRSGMGKVNAGICAHTLAREFGCSSIINTGVAGSLDNAMDIGDFVLSLDAAQHDYDVSPIGFKKGEIPYTGIVCFPADKELLEKAKLAVAQAAPEAKAFLGRVCSGDQFIIDVAKKEDIASTFHGLCCEMEGAAVAQACYLNRVKFVIIRCISDKPDGSEILDFETFASQAALACSKVVLAMLESL